MIAKKVPPTLTPRQRFWIKVVGIWAYFGDWLAVFVFAYLLAYLIWQVNFGHPGGSSLAHWGTAGVFLLGLLAALTTIVQRHLLQWMSEEVIRLHEKGSIS